MQIIAAERILRQSVVKRKVHYGSHSSRGIQVACVFNTLLESVRLNGLSPVDYLRRVVYAALEKPGTVILPWDAARQLAEEKAAPGEQEQKRAS